MKKIEIDFKNVLKAKIRLVLVIFLLLGNAYFSFSGFVAITQEERKACSLLSNIEDFDNLSEKNKEIINNLPSEQGRLVVEYFPSYMKTYDCKNLDLFIVEELLIIFIGIVIASLNIKTNE